VIESADELPTWLQVTLAAAPNGMDLNNLRVALSSRSVIDQAIGIIIGLQRCPPETAFDVLRTVSQNRNIPLRKVAADLVTTTITPPNGQ